MIILWIMERFFASVAGLIITMIAALFLAGLLGVAWEPVMEITHIEHDTWPEEALENVLESSSGLKTDISPSSTEENEKSGN